MIKYCAYFSTLPTATSTSQDTPDQPARTTKDDSRPLRELAFDDEACLGVAHIVGILNDLTRLADALGLQPDPQTHRASETNQPPRRPK